MRRMHGPTAVLVLLAGSLMTAHRSPGAGDVQETDCSDPAYRQFDFWVGDWIVTRADGERAGTNTIRRILGDCVLLEEYTGAGSYTGKSYNVYDRTTGRWHQTWVDNSGLLLRLDGGLRDGRMVLSGDRLDREGRRVIDRISWDPLSDGRVRQLWEVSRDGGETWSTVFEGLYTRR